MHPFKNILVVVKSTKDCRKALHLGIELARCFNAELNVLHLMHDPFGLEHWQLALPSLKAIQEEHENMRSKAREELDAMIAAEQAKGLPIAVSMAEGPPEKEVLRVVQKGKIDLLITVAHAGGYLEQMLFDRLNEELHRKLPCTVMFIKQEPSAVKQQVYCLHEDRVEPCEK